MTIDEHKFMSWVLVALTLAVGAWIIWLDPKEWLLTSICFAVLAVGLWFGLKIKRDALSRAVTIDERSDKAEKDS